MTATATAAAAKGRFHYEVKVDGQTVVEFNEKRTFSHVVIGRCIASTAPYYRVWNAWSKTNQPRGAEQKWAVWGRRQVRGKDVEVLVVPVTHQ